MSPTIRLLRKLHLFIGLFVGLHFCLIATTGAIFVFEPEIAAWSRRNLVSTPGDVGADRAAAEIRAAHPEWLGDGLSFPTEDSPFYRAYLGDAEDPESVFFWTDVLVDPGTGRIVAEIDNSGWNVAGLLQVSIQLHIRLCAGEVGRRIVDCSVTLFVVSLISGLVLWWPGFRKFFRTFQLRLRRNAFTINFDWHRLTGFLAAPLLLVMALTGLLWAFPSVVRPLIYLACFETPAEESPPQEATSVPPSSDATPLSLEQIARRAQERFLDSRLSFVTIGAQPTGTARAFLEIGDFPSPGGVSQEIVFDKYSGEILQTSDQRDLEGAESFIEVWAHPLHYGWFGGLPVKVLYVLATLAVDGLFATGVAMWWIKSRKKRNAESAA